MKERTQPKTSKKATFLLIFLGILILSGIGISRTLAENKKVVQLQEEREIIKVDEKQNKYVGVNENQIINVTLDGVIAYNLEGQEVWSDTLNLDSIVVRQRSPYFAVSGKQSRKVEIFSETGKVGEVTTQYPIIYFAINEKGDAAIIEEMPEGHVVSAYNSKGQLLVKRNTYSKEVGFPMTVEVSPDGKLLLASYINMNNPVITSNIQAIPIDKPKEEALDMMKYGLQIKDSLIYEIEFINKNYWVAIGDGQIIWYTYSGDEVAKKQGIYASYIPYLYSFNNAGSYISVIGSNSMSSNLIHNKDTLYIFGQKGEEVIQKEFTEPITYFYADEKGTIIGEGRRYRGFNKMGNQYFEYKANQDISKLIYLNKHKKAIAITKNKVLLLKDKR